jgi:hypothetical protein
VETHRIDVHGIEIALLQSLGLEHVRDLLLKTRKAPGLGLVYEAAEQLVPKGVDLLEALGELLVLDL